MIREASHAGTWYTHESAQLAALLDQWTSQTVARPSRFAIGPHAGHRFCGKVLAHTYAAVAAYNRSVAVERIVLMGPTHFKYFRGIQTTRFDELETPVGISKVDPLAHKLGIARLDAASDLREHAWEMHLPFIARFLPNAEVLPLLFGGGSESEQTVAPQLVALLDDPHTAFVVSSDFCHWGASFDYRPFANTGPLIHKHIEQMDRDACAILETGSSQQFDAYLDETRNTICGAKPISWLLKLAERAGQPLRFDLLAYDQSSKVRTPSDMSVSYAALASA